VSIILLLMPAMPCYSIPLIPVQFPLHVVIHKQHGLNGWTQRIIRIGQGRFCLIHNARHLVMAGCRASTVGAISNHEVSRMG
jgi:hypothetical protein